MFPGKPEACRRMVVNNIVPPGRVVAGGAVGFRVKLAVDLSFVNILVAIDATDANIAETPVARFPVAGDAGCCKMTSFKMKPSQVVLSDGENDLGESLCVVTAGTIDHRSVFDKLAVVEIFVAVTAL
jgi:hypothetical protein